MTLVHEGKFNDGGWDIAWSRMPYFLAIDKELHTATAKALTKKFSGTIITDDTRDGILISMNEFLIDAILSFRPVPGLREYLWAAGKVDLEGVARTNVAP